MLYRRSAIALNAVDLRKEVVYHMKVDDVMEHMSQNESRISVDSGKRAAEVRPTLRGVLRQRWRGVVKIGNHDYGCTY